MQPPKITLRAARVNAGMSIDYASKMLNISKDTLRNYENGKTAPQWDTVTKMEEIYKYPVSYIFFPPQSV